MVWEETVVIRDAAFGHFWPFGLTTEGETGHVESYYKLLNCRPPVIYHLHHHVYAFWCFDGLTMLKTTTTDASLSLFKSNMQCCQYRMRCYFWLLIPNSKGTGTHHRQRLRERSYCTLFKNNEQNKILVISLSRCHLEKKMTEAAGEGQIRPSAPGWLMNNSFHSNGRP